ncbi:MAG: hypothetical protein AAFX41_16445 [Bacteroidota bacterium]
MRATILTRHPDPAKQGVNIDAGKYHAIRAAIEEIVDERGEIAFSDLMETVEDRIGASFDGSVPWYVTTLKLDLEARGILERVPRASPQRLRRSTP